MRQISHFLLLPLTLLFWLLFASTMILFHVIQPIAHLAGAEALRHAVDIQNGILVLIMRMHGLRVRFHEIEVPKDTTIIFTSNHQSTFDMPPMIWWLRRYKPKFIAKKELEKSVPGISYNLRHGGNLAIDRKDRKKSLDAIRAYPDRLRKNGWSVIIYPEGTRSGRKEMKKWRRGGLATMLEAGRDYITVVPLRIDNSWRISTKRWWRVPFGIDVVFKMLEPAKLAPGESIDAFIDRLEARVGKSTLDD